MSEKVSIIVPVYNGEKYIRLCIDSLTGQSYSNIEIIIINDGSTDSGGRICDVYAANDSRIRTIHTLNLGPAAARNAGIDAASGDLILFVDADDRLEDNAIIELIKKYEQYRSDIVIGDFIKIIDGQGTASGHSNVFSGDKQLTKKDIIEYTRLYLKKPNRYPLFAYSWGRLFKSSIIKNKKIRFNAAMRTFEDVVFNYEYLKYVKKIYFINKVVYDHLIHGGYLSATMTVGGDPGNMFGYRQATAKIGEYLEQEASGIDIKKEVGNAYISLTIIQLVRICGQINDLNKENIHKFVRTIVNDDEVQHNLQYYSPSKGDSRIIPVMMRYKLVRAIIAVCRYKAQKRYGKKKI